MSSNVKQCQAMSSNVKQCQAMSSNVKQCQAMSSEAASVDPPDPEPPLWSGTPTEYIDYVAASHLPNFSTFCASLLPTLIYQNFLRITKSNNALIFIKFFHR